MTLREIWTGIMTPADKLLIFILLILGLTSYAIISRLFPLDEDRIALVEIAGREVMRLSLSGDLPSRKVPLKLEGGEAVLEVSEGRIRMLPMPDELCSKHICSKTGWVGKPWQMIICMPNKIAVRIVGKRKVEDIDLITK